jgi:hypothetical protein
MKKKLTVFIIGIILITSCKTTDSTFKRIYGKYEGTIILDGARKYTVKSGDKLVDIAANFYSDGHYYPVIMLASSDVVLDPDKILPGMVLTIPDLQRNLNDVRAKASIKGVMMDCSVIENNRNRPDTAKGLRELSRSL